MPDAFLPGLFLWAVEDDEMPLIDAADAIHILESLAKAVLDDRAQGATLDLQL